MHLSQGPSIEDLYNRIRNEEWEPDSIVEAIAERYQDSDKSGTDFMLLKCVSALCGPNELASIHVEKGLARFKSQTASVCDKIARSRHQGALPLLSPNCAERPPDSVMAQYDTLIKNYEGVVLQATDAVDALQVLKRTWMQALDYIIKRDSLEQTDHGCHCLMLAGWRGRHRSVQPACRPLARRRRTWQLVMSLTLSVP